MSQQPRSRWLLSVVLVLGAIAFIGFSMLPLFQSGLQESQPSTDAAPAVNQTPLVEQKSKLAAEARDYEVVLQQEPDNQAALRGLVDTRIKLGDLEGAIAPLEKLIALEPNQIEYQLVLGQVYATKKDFGRAIALYDRAIQTKPQDFRLLVAKASILQAQGKTEQAKPLFAQAAALAPPEYKDRINQLATQQPATQQPDANTKSEQGSKEAGEQKQ